MAPCSGPAPDPVVVMGQTVGEIARTHRTPQLPISRHLQELVALLRIGATPLFDGKRTATCGNLMYVYMMAAPRLTKRLMTIAANAESIEEPQPAMNEQITEDAEDVVLELEEVMLPLPGSDVDVMLTPAPAVGEDHESPNGLCAFTSRRCGS
ncbi:unnamed protein product [Closterium sp. NIES-54]